MTDLPVLVAVPVGGVVMQRLSLSYFYDFGVALKPLKHLQWQQGMKVADVWYDLFIAEDTITNFHANSWFWANTRSAYALGQALIEAIRAVRAKDYKLEVAVSDIFAITSAFAAYEPVLRAQLSTADAYFVTPKGGYDTLSLITNAPALFPEGLSQKVPEALSEVREAGKCLAFELCTAAGIHALRALEIVLKAYFKHVTHGEALPKNRNVGAYLKRLKELKVGDEKVLAVLVQIKDLHRNSLMHPEETLDKESAIDLFGIVRSAIGAMLRGLPVLTGGPIGALGNQ